MDLQVVTELSYCYSISAATMSMIIREVQTKLICKFILTFLSEKS